jgi:hypothetical protein
MALTQWQLKPVATDTIASGDFVAFSDEGEAGDPINKLTVDNLMETGLPLVTEDAIAVASDYILFLDGGATGNTNKEQFADVMTAIAGTGLSASSGVINVDASQAGITTVGTIGTGVWEGTTVAVAQGGTGATSLSNLITLGTHTTGNYAATITAGTGLTSTGATSGEGIAHSLSVDAAQSQITTVGTIGTGVWQGTPVTSSYINAAQTGITSLGTQAADFKIGNGYGLVVGHTAQLTVASVIPEIQILGTDDGTDSGMVIGRWGGGSGGKINLVHSRAAIGSNTVTNDGDEIGIINFIADNGTNLNTTNASISVTHTGTFSSVVPTNMVFKTSTTTSGGVTALTLDTSQNATFAGSISIPATSKLYLDGGGNTYIWESTTDTFQIVTNGTLGLQVNASQNIWIPNGDVFMAPTQKLYFDNGNNTYISETSGDVISMTVNNIVSARFNSTGILAHDGTVSNPSYSFNSDTDTGMWWQTVNQIDWSVGGQNDMRLESDGDLHVDGDVIAFSSTIASDIALKENITTLPNALETINRLRGVSFDWKREDRGSSIGVIAQEVEKVFPELIDEHALNGMKTVNYSALIGVLIEAVKELSDKVEA